MRSVGGGERWSNLHRTGLDDDNTYHLVEPPGAGALYAATSGVHDLYQSTYLSDDAIDGGGGRIMRSWDEGAIWSLASDTGHPVVWLAVEDVGYGIELVKTPRETAGAAERGEAARGWSLRGRQAAPSPSGLRWGRECAIWRIPRGMRGRASPKRAWSVARP